MKQGMSTQISTINQIERAMRKKVKKLIPEFDQMDVVQTLTTTQGEKAQKVNPAIQETRAMFRDYCSIVKVQQELANGNKAKPEKSNVDLIRSRLKLVQ